VICDIDVSNIASANSRAKRVVAAIVSFNTCELLRDCLLSIVDQVLALGGHVTVVDNASSDGSAEMVRTDFPTVKLLPLDENVGFGRAMNLAFRTEGGPEVEYLLLLNSDALFPPTGLAELIAFAERHPDIGVFTCLLRAPDGSIERNCIHHPALLRRLAEAFALHRLRKGIGLEYADWPFTVEREVESISGAVMLVRANIWFRMGGFEDRFFMYLEDTDFCWRLRKQGLRIVMWPGLTVTHHFGSSSPTPAYKVNLYLTSQTVAYRKWYGRPGAVLIQLLEATYTTIYSVEVWYRVKYQGDDTMAVRLKSNAYTLRWIITGKWLRLLV